MSSELLDVLAESIIVNRGVVIEETARLVRQSKPVAPATILGDGQFRMMVTGHGYYDADGNRKDEPALNYQLWYEGYLVRKNKETGMVAWVRTIQGERCFHRIAPQAVVAVLGFGRRGE